MRLASKRNNGSNLEKPSSAEKGNLRAKNRWKIAAIAVISIAALILTLSTPSVQTVYGGVAEAPGIESLQIGSIVQFGGYDWRVLDVQDDKALILFETIVENRAYSDIFKKVTWETCTLRKYLNEGFYNKFSDMDKARIAETTITNNNNPWYGTSGGNATKDRIFLLSIEEVVKYFGDSGDLENRKGWDLEDEKPVLGDADGFVINDQYNTARIAKDANGTASWWWLRSPGSTSVSAALVYPDGYVVVGGLLVDICPVVRPALWLNLSNYAQERELIRIEKERAEKERAEKERKEKESSEKERKKQERKEQERFAKFIANPAPGSIVPFGGYDWLVLDVQNGKALLLSETIVESRAYNDEFKEVTWETCTLRGYLNGEFHNKFSAEEKALIAETTITNNDNPWYGTSGGNTTKNRIFLLSLEEVVKYFGDSGQLASNNLKIQGGFNDLYDFARMPKDAKGEASWWWLRSPGRKSNSAAYVSGGVRVDGSAVYIAVGVRPALWLNL